MLNEFFDPKSEVHVRELGRPHWSQAGAVVFITFRTSDSIPRTVVEGWERDKRDWLRLRGFDVGTEWTSALAELSSDDRAVFHKHFNRQREMALDTCHGRCLLKRPELAAIVAESLLHFDNDRYHMGDFIVMPNHVHLLATFPTANAMKAQCDSWLHYTAARINRVSGERGKFWQQEPFDHLVRNPEQYEALRVYIAENPHKASLQSGEYFHRIFGG